MSLSKQMEQGGTDIIQVLDHGFVRFDDMMGGDNAVVKAARVSHKSEARKASDDEKLIRYMLNHKHGTPFEHAVFTFHVKLPVFVARQWIRHRMSSYNETSFRYREAPDEFYIPEKWRAQEKGPGANKQGSVAADLAHDALGTMARLHSQASMFLYRQMLDMGAAREMARIILPTNIYTEWYWTVNARALMLFLELRSDAHAQWETRQYSDALAQFFQRAMPLTYAAFTATLDPDKYRGLAFPAEVTP